MTLPHDYNDERRGSWKMMPVDYYDEVFTTSENYLVGADHATTKFVWDAVLEKLPLECSILDVGCGPGQFATLCIRAKHRYVGVDYSEVAIKRARVVSPSSAFHWVDVVKAPALLVKGDYDVATFVEFLEHVDEDLAVLESVPEGKRVVLTVPRFWTEGHVRVFKTVDEVAARYGGLVDIESLDTVFCDKLSTRLAGPRGPLVHGKPWTIHILSGVRQNVK